MKVINNEKGLKLEMSYHQASIITEALRHYSTDRAKELLDIMMNNQEVKAND